MVADPYRPPVRSAASIAALTVSIFGLFLAMIGAGEILSIVFGLIAVGLAVRGLVLANRHGRGGRGLATWALILGIVGFAVGFIGFIPLLIATLTR
jgi:hypothetical protein